MAPQHRLSLNPSSPQDLLATLQHLGAFLSELPGPIWPDAELSFWDSATQRPLALDAPIHPEIPNFSELAFYLIAADHPACLPGIEAITRIAIKKNRPRPVWVNAEVQLGLSAAFALAHQDPRYLPRFVAVLRSLDLKHEVYEDFLIGLLLDRWPVGDEVLQLLAARSGSIAGQFGIENLPVPALDRAHKGLYLRHLLEDCLQAPVVHADLLVDALQRLDIAIDFEHFETLFVNRRPVFTEHNIPTLNLLA